PPASAISGLRPTRPARAPLPRRARASGRAWGAPRRRSRSLPPQWARLQPPPRPRPPNRTRGRVDDDETTADAATLRRPALRGPPAQPPRCPPAEPAEARQRVPAREADAGPARPRPAVARARHPGAQAARRRAPRQARRAPRATRWLGGERPRAR